MGVSTQKNDVRERVEREALKIALLNADLAIPELTDLGEIPDHTELGNLDSFSIVLLILALEDVYEIPLLEDMGTFDGKDFDDLTDFIIDRMPASSP